MVFKGKFANHLRLPRVAPFGLVILWAVASLAAGESVREHRSELLLRDSAVNNRSGTRKTLGQLSLHTDLWHDSIIRGDHQQAIHYQQMLAKIVRADLAASSRRVRALARETVLSAIEPNSMGESKESVGRFMAKRRELSDVFSRNLRLLREKAGILQRIDRTEVSIDTYGLLGKYMDILRRQIGLEKIWLATAANSYRRQTQ